MNNQSGINYFFENFTNLDPQTFKVFYNFQQTGSGAAIPSVPFGDGLYSGTINNYAPSFWSYSGSGFFTGGQYITINNSNNNLFSGSNLSFITVAQKANTANNILFSCADTGLVDSSFAYRGFTFGLNSANKLYFEYYGPSGLEIFTLPNILAEKNSLSVVIGEDTVTLGQYDFFNSQLNSETFSINSDFVFNGSTWIIGGNPTAPSFDARCGFTGWLDTFIVINSAISESDCRFLNSGICSNILTNNLISGFVDTVVVTGTTTGLVPTFSGVTGWNVSATGTVQDSYGNLYTGILPPIPLTGVISGSGVQFLTGISSVALVTGQEDIISINYPYVQSFFYDLVNYSSFPVSGDDQNYCYFYTGLMDTTTGLFIKSISNYNKIKNNFNTNVSGGITFYANGVFLPSGTSTPSNNIYDPAVTLEYFYNLENFNVNTTGFLNNSDYCIYDVITGNNQIVRSGFNYSGGSNLLITGATDNSLIFFNGISLNSGADYFKSGTNFYFGVSGLYGGTTGDLTLIQIPSGFRYTTDVGPAIFSSGKFPPGFSLLFLNGVRQIESQSYISASKVDLLSGSGNYWLKDSQIYNNNALFFT